MSGDNFGLQTASGHLTVPAESKEPYAAEQLASLRADAEAIIARYPQKRSALLPMLHLVQSVDGYVTGRGIALCAEMLGLTTAEVSGVATFYTQYKRHPNGDYTVGVCTNTLCAIMGGDEIWDRVSEHLGIGHDETTPDGRITLERVECNAACDFAPVVMTNWEFFDNQTPESTVRLVDDLREGKDVRPTRGPSRVCTFKEMSRTLAGFSDGLADEGVGAGPASLAGLRVARDNGWTAPGAGDDRAIEAAPADADADLAPGKPAESADHERTDASPAAAPEAVAADEAEPETGSAPAKDEHTPHDEAAGQPSAKAPSAQADAADAQPAPATDVPVGTPEATTPGEPERGSAAGVDPSAGDQAPASAEPTLTTTPAVGTPSTERSAMLPVFEQLSAESAAPSGDEAPAVDDDVAAARARIAAVGRSTAGPAEEGGDDPGTGDAASDLAFAPGAYGEDSAEAGPRGEGPQGWTVKGNASSRLFHTPESPWYRRTKAEVWFRHEAAALAAGFRNALDKDDDGKDEQ